MRDGWNVHNDIGMSLEMIARGVFNPGVVYGADNTIYSADSIESRTFAECIICLLRNKYGYTYNDEVDAYIAKLTPVFGKSLHDFEPALLQSLLDEFKALTYFFALA